MKIYLFVEDKSKMYGLEYGEKVQVSQSYKTKRKCDEQVKLFNEEMKRLGIQTRAFTCEYEVKE